MMRKKYKAKESPRSMEMLSTKHGTPIRTYIGPWWVYPAGMIISVGYGLYKNVHLLYMCSMWTQHRPAVHGFVVLKRCARDVTNCTAQCRASSHDICRESLSRMIINIETLTFLYTRNVGGRLRIHSSWRLSESTSPVHRRPDRIIFRLLFRNGWIKVTTSSRVSLFQVYKTRTTYVMFQVLTLILSSGQNIRWLLLPLNRAGKLYWTRKKAE